MEGIFALKSAGSGHSENALREALAMIRLAAETYFAPLYCGTQGPLSDIVCGFNALMEDECKQVLPVFERLHATGTDSSILAGQVSMAKALHAAPDEGSRLPELLAGDGLFNVGMPAGKQTLDFSEHDCGEALSIRAATDIEKCFELADKMSPAKLPYAFLVISSVGGVIVACDDARESGSKD